MIPTRDRPPTGSRRPAHVPRVGPVPKLEYLPGLDGLRALAVVAVMLYHAQQNMPSSWMPGGFLGVEVFFVISGYLITLLLISEHQRTDRVDLRQFWTRRARRLLPALFAVLVVTMGIVGIAGRFSVSLQEHVKDFRGTWASAWVYATNWYQILAGLNYADQHGRPPLVRHLWSLAVEEQFYLIWPLVMWVVLRRFSKRLPAVGVAFVSLSLAITVGMAVAYRANDINRVNFLYLSTLTRSSGLLLGAALAVFWRPWLVPHSGARHRGRRFDLLAVLGLGVLAVTLLKWHFLIAGEDGPRGYDLLFRGGFLVVGLATLLVILATTHPGSFIGRRIFASQPLVWIGTRSYGLYLWHWPIFQLTRPRGDVSLLDPKHPDVNMGWLPALVLRLALTGVVTELSYRFLETPIRTGALGRWWARNRDGGYDSRRRTFAIAGTAVILLAVIPATSAYSAHDVLAEQAECNRNPQACALIDNGAKAGNATRTSVSRTTVVGEPGETTDATTGDRDPAVTDPSGTDGSGTQASPVPTDATDPPATPPGTPPGTATLPPSDIKPLAIGDSVMLGAMTELVDAGFRVDAKESRQFSKALPLVQFYKSKGKVGKVVVIALGTNGSLTDKVIDKLMLELKDVPHVVFVTPQINGRTPEMANHDVLIALPARYSNVSIVDWREAAQDKLEFYDRPGKADNAQIPQRYFWSDQIHLAPMGRKYYAQLIVEEVLRLGDA